MLFGAVFLNLFWFAAPSFFNNQGQIGGTPVENHSDWSGATKKQ